MIHRRVIAILLCVTFFFLTAIADDTKQTPPVTIRSIRIEGNDVTQPNVLLREMSLHVGDSLTQRSLDKDRDRIYNLALFNKVSIAHYDSASVTDLVVTVVERWYIFPTPIINMRSQGVSSLSYGLGITHQNFLGRDEKVSLAYSTGYDHSASFSYQNPRLIDNDDIFLRTQIQYRDAHTLDNSNMLFEQISRLSSLSLGKRFGYSQLVVGTVGYQEWQIPDASVAHTISPDGTDRFIQLEIQYTFDARNVREYPTDGWYFDITSTKDGWRNESTVNTLTNTVDLRMYYVLVDNISFAWRGFSSIVTGGPVPIYHWLTLGTRMGVRGYNQRDYTGEDLVGGSVEVRIPLIAPRFITWNFFNIHQFNTMRFGIYAALFADVGKIWFRTDEFEEVPWLASAGAGLHFLLPYGLILRTELSINALGQLRVGLTGGLPF
jgi:outer membrane protein assembly factor BamA